MRLQILTLITAACSVASFCKADSIIFANNAGSSGVQEYDANTGVLIRTIDTPEMMANNGRGVVLVGDVMYYTAASSNSVYAYNVVTNTDLGVQFSVSGASGLATMAYDGTNLYLGDYSGTNNVYKYSLGGSLLQTIALSECTSYCDGLEYAQGHLVSNEKDGGYGPPSAYDVYTTSGTLLTHPFIDSSGIGGTGIAFDGTNYWVSDLAGGNLYEYDTSGTQIGITALQHATHLIEDLSFNYATVLTPEPSSFLLFGSGLVGVAGFMLRRLKRS